MAKRTNDDDDDDRDLDDEEGSARDDEDGDDEDEQPKKAAPKKVEPKAKPAPAKAKPAPAKAKKDDEDEDEEDGDEDEEDDDAGDEEESEASASGSDGDDAEDSEEEKEEVLPAQLGVQRYVYAAVFGGIILGAYVLGRTIDGLWQWASSKDAVILRAPWLASVPDESKANYSLIIGGLLALLYGLYKIRRPGVRAWLDEVTTELVKVKWPSRKDVFNSTTVVLTTTAVAVVYLFLLDRFWGFVTGLIYGGGT